MSTTENLAARCSTLMTDRPLAVRVLAGLWAVVTAVHVAIWLMIAAIGGHLDQPWWLAVSVPLGIVLLAAWWCTSPRSTDGATADDELL